MRLWKPVEALLIASILIRNKTQEHQLRTEKEVLEVEERRKGCSS